MGELINVNFETDQASTLEKELLDDLLTCETFQDFFVKASELRVKLDSKGLRTLRDVVGRFVLKFDGKSIVYLCDSITTEMFLPCKQEISPVIREKALQNELLNNFNSAFPDYELIGAEVPVKGIGRIDILAEDKQTKRPIIIELKIKSKNPNKQLLAYASRYENPIIVGITEDDLPEGVKHEDVIYHTFKTLKEGAAQWVN